MSWSDEARARLEQDVRLAGTETFAQVYAADIRAALEEMETVKQTSGDLCDSCGWRTVIGGQCVKCAGEKAEAKLAEAEEELKYALRNLDDLVSAVGSPTNGTAVGYALVLVTEVERLREALEQIDRETRSASDVGLLRMGSIARAALRGER